jgi:lysophospholipase L1-like esterase
MRRQRREIRQTLHPSSFLLHPFRGRSLRLCVSAVNLAVALVFASGCGQTSEPAAQEKPTVKPRFLALGDSYTIGQGVKAGERWPVQLSELLKKDGVDLGAPQIIARTGWTTRDLSTAIDNADPKGPYELVALLIGVNNQFQGLSEEDYRKEFAALLQRAIAFAGGKPARVVVLSIPDYGVTPFAEGSDRAAIAAAIDRFNAINKEETKKANARYVDVTPISRKKEPDLIAEDGLHPSGKMYKEWAALVRDGILQALMPAK